MAINAEIVERVSQKGNNYFCVVIHLTDTYSKTVFLEKAELELMKAVLNKSK